MNIILFENSFKEILINDSELKTIWLLILVERLIM